MATDGQWLANDIIMKVEKVFGMKPCKWQIEAAQALLRGDDVVVVVRTGLGKTLAFIIPLILEPLRIILVITPLTQLSIQHADSLSSKGIPTISLSRSSMHDQEQLKAIAAGKYRAIILSPECFNDPSFQRILGSGNIKHKIQTLVVDEAHTLKDWACFRPEMETVQYIRNQFRGMTIYATTATITPLDIVDLKHRLQMDPERTTTIHRCNDRPNIDWIVQPFRHSRSSWLDLRFLVPSIVNHTDSSPRVLIFV
ncbi:hypothetical protein FRC14_000373 [Serendipita sp. 396]|nr:hypothetical protein FRC14_000373 [Serendipita sp. 396]KAG8776756.1 hypothetical protein FRC15_011783 [Serendipita sp. 397]KAG8794105.1 hypothetical protein FRC16_010707 [Serendipita sp. 398]KAG8818148.1 hypothetical protein FRC19_010841 [Serendipita sp. 401]KAG8819467.1 hypothetical protein FRC18_012086 [Serendipita sp. 400]KAG8846014.1 hypothetical protein FRB91_001261 [Serendipita sp. 411]KAG8857894.1 hypothetical protein FRC20_000189 [Serendipita sp. 405]KAG9050045.1 hypothetical prot